MTQEEQDLYFAEKIIIEEQAYSRGYEDAKKEFDRPHGEWIKTGRTNIYGGFEIECSHCHNKLMVSPKRWEVGENFCDVCGSQNKEVKRNERMEKTNC